jgi:hypothetical protein
MATEGLAMSVVGAGRYENEKDPRANDNPIRPFIYLFLDRLLAFSLYSLDP